MSPRSLTLLTHCPGTVQTEQYLHSLLRKSHAHHEWFEPTEELASLIAYVKRFQTTDGWQEANEGPAEWADVVSRDGFTKGVQILADMTSERFDWCRMLERREERCAQQHCAPDWFHAWQMETSGNTDDESMFTHSIMSNMDVHRLDWTVGNGTTMHGGGLQNTAELLVTCLRKGPQHVAAAWIQACIHDLAKSETSRFFLEKRVQDLPALRKQLSGIVGCGWHHLSSALPMVPIIPDRCLLSIEEFVTICGRHRRTIVAESRIVCRWHLGDLCGLTKVDWMAA